MITKVKTIGDLNIGHYMTDLKKQIYLLELENEMLKKENEFLKETVRNLSLRVVPSQPINHFVSPLYDRTKYID